MKALLATVSLILWLVLMVWLYSVSPQWFFMPFFFVSTFAGLRLMETGGDEV
jgi:hypothetical protein